MKRKVINKVKGFLTKDGAGVSLTRVLGNTTYHQYDPILLLDSFDSYKPADYIASFPMHPHRGIETISYVYYGQMQHRDSLGNEDTIKDGEVQWMTAGSGIMHEEIIPAVNRLLGVQLWLNLPSQNKMVEPFYKRISNQEIREIIIPNGKIRVLAGKYEDKYAYQSPYLPLDYYDIHLDKNSSYTLATDEEKMVILFTLQGEIFVEEEVILSQTAAKLTNGKTLTITTKDTAAQVLFISSLPLHEEIAWGGPIVMNTKEELQKAFSDLKRGTFLKKSIKYE